MTDKLRWDELDGNAVTDILRIFIMLEPTAIRRYAIFAVVEHENDRDTWHALATCYTEEQAIELYTEVLSVQEAAQKVERK